MSMRLLALIGLALAGCSRAPADGQDVLARAPAPLLIETGGGTLCNGVRLDPDTVATAAHCLADGTGITLRDGANRVRATDVVLHPAFALLSAQGAGGVDLARLSVAAPAGDAAGRVALRPVGPGPVTILALAPDGTSRRVSCDVLGQSGRLTELACAVALGWSGAPVVQDGALVGILSARGRADGVAVAQIADATLLSTF